MRIRSLAAAVALTAAAIASTGVTAASAQPAPAGTAVVTAVPGPYGCNYTNAEPQISRGSKGAAVKEAQCLLRHWGESLGSSGIDGDFGPATEAAVRSFQSKYCGLSVDGIVGPKTWHALKNDGC